MNPISLRDHDRPILREPAGREELSASPLLYGIPVLFPANRTKDASFCFDGVRYTLPMNEPHRFNNLHGCLYRTPFTVTEQTADRVCSFLRNRGEYYPFPFTMSFTDTVSEEGYRRDIVIENDGDTAMPITLSFHSTFVEPETFTVCVGERFEFDRYYIPTGVMLALNETERTFCTACSPHGKTISAYYTSQSNIARIGEYRYTVSSNFDEWIFYNGSGTEGFLCVEPQCGEVNGLNRENGHLRLEAGGRAAFSLEISKMTDASV